EIEGAKRAGELGAVVPEDEGLVLSETHDAGVLGVFAEGGARGGRVAVEHASAAHGEVEPLVGVERYGIGEADAIEERTGTRGESGEATVRGVDVEPEIFGAGEFCECGDRVYGAAAHGAGAGDDAEGQVACGAVGADLAGEVVEIDLLASVGAHAARIGRSDAEHAGGFADGEVAFFGD